MDVAGIPTTLGSVVFKDNVPTRDAFVTAKLKKAGAIILAKVTLGEMGGGDSYGSLYGVSRNPYDPERTVGGSSGGTGAAVSANFATIGVGQEGFASIRRPSTWNSIVGMRPTPGLVSRCGVWAGWPSRRGSLGPMTRTVTDMAKLLDVMVGYDPDDPVTALGVGKIPESYTKFLDKNGLKGARIGILREPMGYTTEPDSADFKTVTKDVRQSGGRAEGRGCGDRRSDRRCRVSTSCWPDAARARAKASATARRSTSRGIRSPFSRRWRRSATRRTTAR